jgi:hypothetical protein
MAKTKQNKRLYSRMRASGVRKKIARQLSELPGHASRGKKAPKQLKDHSGRGKRKAAARKAARTRRTKAASRSRAARKGARKRAKS